MTPEGMKRTENVSPNESLPQWSRRKFVAVFASLALIASSLLAWQFLRPKTTALAEGPAGAKIPAKSIAVLPFDNLSRDPDNAFFAEGVQDEILTRLAKVADLKVISRTSTQHFKSSPENLPEIAQQLGVRNILEGSVQKANDEVRVNVQLINATNDAHLWADIYDRKLTDLFAVESDIAKTIADTLQVKLTGEEKISIAKKPTSNPEAYELYVKGRYFWDKRTADGLRRSIDCFNQATDKDPNFALAYAGLAQAWFVSSAYNNGTPKECFPKAEAAAKKALALDETCSDAHAALGGIRQLYYFDTPGAIAEFQRAIQLNPNDATAHHWLGNHSLAYSGQFARALVEMKRAQDLDPLSLVINTNLGWSYVYSGRLDEGIAQIRKTLELDGDFYYAIYTLGQALELKGSTVDAMALYKKAVAMSDDPFPLSLLGHLDGSTGHKDEAEKILAQLQRSRKPDDARAYCIALVYLGLGNRDEALHWLEESYRERDGFTIGEIRVDPFLNSLHGDPRFEALAEKIVPAREFAKTATPSE